MQVSMQVKMFRSFDVDELSQEVNDFLNSIPVSFHIKDIKYQVTPCGTANQLFTAMVIFVVM